jgi:MFS family permease
MMFFWSLFDGMLAYISPLIITEHGLSKTYMGFIVGSSSIFGALFDMIAIKILPSTHYRRVFLIMFSLCLVYPFVLFGAHTIAIYLVAMAIWGIYYDLKNFGLFDYVSQNTTEKEHASSFGLIQVLQSMGYLIAPIMVSALIIETITWKPFAYALIFLGISLLCFFFLITNRHVVHIRESSRKLKIFMNMRMWFSLDRIIFPVLVMTFVLYLIDAFFWTIGPLLAENFSLPGQHGEFILTAYTFPGLVVGWFVNSATGTFGKKRTAFLSLLIGSVLLSLFVFVAAHYYFALTIVFIASMFLSLALPAINGAYADFIQEKKKYGEEVETLTDLYTNLGYIVGPISAGFLADILGNAASISSVGIFGIVVAIILMLTTPRHIEIREKNIAG